MSEYILGALALAVSLWAARLSLRATREEVNHGSVSDIYSEFRRITELRLNYPEHTHILEPPENYVDTVKKVANMVSSYESEQKAKYLLRERAVALTIFQIFEQVIYQHKQAQEESDTIRAKFLKEVLDYMTGRLFMNPRLLYLWWHKGGNLKADFEIHTQVYYDTHVPTVGRHSTTDATAAFDWTEGD